MKIFAAVFSLIISLTTSMSVAAHKYMYFFGGGGQDTASSAPEFNESMQAAARLRNQGWTIFPYYGAIADQQTAAIAAAAFGQPVNAFTGMSYSNAIAEISNKISNDEFVRNDELLIIFDTHGNYNSAPNAQYHLVAAADQTVSTGDIRYVVQAALDKGIKVAVFDFSCFGGATMAGIPENACGISTSRSNRMGYIGDAKHFLTQAGRSAGKSLEDFFLGARASDHVGASEPQINTTTGQMTMSALAGLDATLMDFSTIQLMLADAFANNMQITETDLRQTQLVMNSLIRGMQTQSEALPIVERVKMQVEILRLNMMRPSLVSVFNQIATLRRQIDPAIFQQICNNSYSYSQRPCLTGAEILLLSQTSPSTLSDFGMADQVNRLLRRVQTINTSQTDRLIDLTMELVRFERVIYNDFYNWTKSTLPRNAVGSTACSEFIL